MGFLVLSTSMTLNDLEPPKEGFLPNFLHFLAEAHISRVNYDEIDGERPRQPANLQMKFSASNIHFRSLSPDP